MNGPAEILNHKHLLQYDSTHGRFPFNIDVQGESFIVNNKKIPLLRKRNIEDIDCYLSSILM